MFALSSALSSESGTEITNFSIGLPMSPIGYHCALRFTIVSRYHCVLEARNGKDKMSLRKRRRKQKLYEVRAAGLRIEAWLLKPFRTGNV